MSLCGLQELFQPEENFNNDDGTEESSVEYSVYPQAGICTAGHFQAKGLMTSFAPLVRELNGWVRRNSQVQANNLGSDDSDRPESDEAEDVSVLMPIVGLGCQGYNSTINTGAWWTASRCPTWSDHCCTCRPVCTE